MFKAIKRLLGLYTCPLCKRASTAASWDAAGELCWPIYVSITDKESHECIYTCPKCRQVSKFDCLR